MSPVKKQEVLEQRLSRRYISRFFKVSAIAAGISGCLLLSLKYAYASCTGDQAPNFFYQKLVEPYVSNHELLEDDPGGRIYVRMNLPIKDLQTALNIPELVESESENPGEKELLHCTIEEALNALPLKPDTHILELDREGLVTKIYNGSGFPLDITITKPNPLKCRPTYIIRIIEI